MTWAINADEQYLAQLGRAVYSFSYVEWQLIWIFEEAGTRGAYFGEGQWVGEETSGQLANRFEKTVEELRLRTHPLVDQLSGLLKKFRELVNRRNAILHSHPFTDSDTSQRLLRRVRGEYLRIQPPVLEAFIFLTEELARDAGAFPRGS